MTRSTFTSLAEALASLFSSAESCLTRANVRYGLLFLTMNVYVSLTV